MARNTGDVGATDRLNIDTNLLDPEREVIAIVRPNGEMLLYQEDRDGPIVAGRKVVLHYTNAEDRVLQICQPEERTTFDVSVGKRVTFETHPVIDLETDDEFELWDELPDDDHSSITPLTLIN
jgi:hypothetical protein